ncbi:MAG TPA: group 1 truncated hemoglobin [Tepidisphaeraceae bacterium]|nr:group 1 truncated hemoglobin [Tepidisphaeraceae bacterium]
MKRAISSAIVMTMILFPAVGCSSQGEKDKDFHTSGNREADQRAEQRIARDQQIRGEGTGRDDQKNVKKALYDRLGGEAGISAIVDDWVTRLLNDPRVNFERKDVKAGSILNRKSVEWKPSPDQVQQLKKHFAQFLTLSTGGPTHYDGQDMKEAHADMHIANAEFDAAIGDLKATLDKIGTATEEQKELLAIIESTRPQVVEER